MILVIGSNSFAGSSFINFLLNNKNKVIGVSRSNELKNIYLSYKENKFYKTNFKFIKADINKKNNLNKIINIVKKKKIKYLVNFAAQGMVAESWINPEDWYQTNILSNCKLIKELSKINIKKYLNFSTPEVYGNTPNLIKENFNFNPSTPYAISRASQDMNLLAYYKYNNFPVVFTRTANIFGPYQQLYRIIPKAIMCAKQNRKIELHGGGSSIRSFILMEDVNRALYKILFDRNNAGQTYHISTNQFISIKKLVFKIFKKINSNTSLIKISNDRKGKDRGYLLNSNKLRKNYKWKDKCKIDEGIDKTIKWIEQHYRTLKNEKLEYSHKS
jgi:dTDP-glucose 4,6-dehydratase